MPWTVKVCFPASIKADMLMGKYKELIESLYIQPKNEAIVGCSIEKMGLPMK